MRSIQTATHTSLRTRRCLRSLWNSNLSISTECTSQGGLRCYPRIPLFIQLYASLAKSWPNIGRSKHGCCPMEAMTWSGPPRKSNSFNAPSNLRLMPRVQLISSRVTISAASFTNRPCRRCELGGSPLRGETRPVSNTSLRSHKKSSRSNLSCTLAETTTIIRHFKKLTPHSNSKRCSRQHQQKV